MWFFLKSFRPYLDIRGTCSGNFRITDDDLGAGGPKTKYKANVEAIRVLQTLDAEQRQATAEEQEILSRYSEAMIIEYRQKSSYEPLA